VTTTDSSSERFRRGVKIAPVCPSLAAEGGQEGRHEPARAIEAEGESVPRWSEGSVLLRLSAGQTDVEALLPDRGAASHPEHVLQHRLDESRQKATRQKATRERRRAVGRRSSGS
jgi:hypothetical protein